MKLDPRTKLLLVFMEAFLVLAVAGGERLYYFRLFFAVLPFILLIFSGRFGTFAAGIVVFTIAELVKELVFPKLQGGIISIFVMMIILLISRFLPAFLMGAYVIRTTKVSEFKAAMERMHVPDAITIPMCVMFRFFPTVKEENESIKAAMRMRGIRLGGGKASEMLEYRMVPMLSCSARIGDELAASALTRGLGISKKRTNICRIGFGPLDILMFIIAISSLVYWITGV